MKIILKKQKIRISFGSIVTEMADTMCGCWFFGFKLILTASFLKKLITLNYTFWKKFNAHL